MDLETENRIAAILMKEAAEMRQQADREGLQAYLRDPKARGRPNSRFLTATVLGVQQANRVVEVNEMWRVRQKEKELAEQIRKRTRAEGHRERSHTSSQSYTLEKVDQDSCSSGRTVREDFSPRDDEEMEEFLRARAKRGRGAVGSRMDEPDPYLPSAASQSQSQSGSETNFRERREYRVLGPVKPSKEDNLLGQIGRMKSDKSHSKRSKTKHQKKHRFKEKSKKKNEKKNKKRSKRSD